jgi:7-cyano-7-deazaguanine synthase in queuosine biosynthesis
MYNDEPFVYITKNYVVDAILKLCPVCETVSKFKFKKNGVLKPCGKQCIKCYSRTSNFKKLSEGYFIEYYKNNKETINNASKKRYQDNKISTEFI